MLIKFHLGLYKLVSVIQFEFRFQIYTAEPKEEDLNFFFYLLSVCCPVCLSVGQVCRPVCLCVCLFVCGITSRYGTANYTTKSYNGSITIKQLHARILFSYYIYLYGHLYRVCVDLL